MGQGRVVREDFLEEGKEIARSMRGKENLKEGFWVGCGGAEERTALWVNVRCPVHLKLIVLKENSVSELR